MIPEGAQLRTKSSPPVYYRWRAVIFNDGDVGFSLSFYSDCHATWRGTNQQNPGKFAEESLSLLPGVPPIDRAVMEAEAREADRIRLGADYERIQKLREENRKKNEENDRKRA